MAENRIPYGALVEKRDGKRPLGNGRIILKLIFKDGIVCADWIDLVQDLDRWRALVNAVMNLLGYIKCGEFLGWLRNC